MIRKIKTLPKSVNILFYLKMRLKYRKKSEDGKFFIFIFSNHLFVFLLYISLPKKENYMTNKKIRLNKYLSIAGIASRKADELIADGRIIVNGKKLRNLACRLMRKKTKYFTIQNK